MQCRQATYSDRDAWDDYALCHPEGSAYHLYAWKEAVEESYGFCGVYLLAENERGICGILPLIDFRVPVFRNALISLPYCDAGGILADDAETEQALIAYAQLTASSMRTEIRLRSFKPLHLCGQNRTGKVSMVLDLPENSGQLMDSYKSKYRLKIKKPMREGLTVKFGSSELLDDFYPVMARNMRNLGSPVHSRFWFHAIVSGYGDKAKVAVVYMPDKTPAAAGIILLHPSRVANPWASSLRQYNQKRPNMLLYWAFLAFAADNGYRVFDFGRSTPGEGTYDFKQQWGAKPHALYWYDLSAKKTPMQDDEVDLSSVKTSFKRQLLAGLWQKLPQSGTDWLGPKFRKYISL